MAALWLMNLRSQPASGADRIAIRAALNGKNGRSAAPAVHCPATASSLRIAAAGVVARIAVFPVAPKASGQPMAR
ncbi:MAG: hypothetical protein ACXWJ5_01750, partial [Xanthobacteraceae bacterium]